MYISGAGIPSPLRVEIDTDFRVETELALKWAQLSSGTWVATDGGAASDIYRSRISVRAREDVINDIIMAIFNNRTAGIAGENNITLNGFTDNEKIFGEDVDHTGDITAVVISMSDRHQMAFKSWRLTLELQAVSVGFVGSPGTVTLTNFDYLYKGYAKETINRYDSYQGNFYFADHRADHGVFEGTAYLSLENMITFRRSLATQRGAPITTANMGGVANVFGPTRDNTWPKNITYIEVKDLGYWGLHHKMVSIKGAEVL